MAAVYKEQGKQMRPYNENESNNPIPSFHPLHRPCYGDRQRGAPTVTDAAGKAVWRDLSAQYAR